MHKELGKITSVRLGSGGYQDAQFGIWFNFGNTGWGVGDGRGVWGGTPSPHAKWTLADKEREFGKIMWFIEETMSQAKVSRVEDLKGIPVEVTFNHQYGKLESWRILTEVL